MERSRKSQCFWSLLVGLALGMAAAGPARAAPPPKGGSPCDPLLDTSDADFDGFSDKEECLGLSGRSVAFSYPGCLTTPTAAPNCLDHNVRDLFVEVRKDTASTGRSGFDENFGGLGPISNAELFQLLEAPQSSGGLGINVHAVPAGSLDNSLRPRGVTVRQSGVILQEDRSLGFLRDVSGNLVCPDPPPPTGITYQGNPNEFGNPQVLTQRIFDRVDCVFGNLASPGNFSEKRLHLKNTVAHEVGHTIEVAPDPTSHHTATGSGYVMDAAIAVETRGGSVSVVIPTIFSSNSRAAITRGVTAAGETVLCGDSTTFDGDDLENCLTTPEP